MEQFFSGDFAFRATGACGASQRELLKMFGIQLYRHGDASAVAPRDWYAAFSRLETLLENESVVRSASGNRVVFLDEFPWFATQRSSFVRAFANFWNRYSNSNSDLIVIICGSATSWIIENVLDDGGDLFNRVTCPIFLEAFTFAETEAFFNSRGFEWNRFKIAECQMVFGGLPFFFERLNPADSLAQNIDRLCLAEHAMFRNETSTLLETTLRKSPAYSKVLSELANHREGMKQTDLEQAVGVSHNTFFKVMAQLANCGYIKRTQVPHVKGKQFFVQLVDPFILFHYKFIAPSIEGDRNAYGKWQDFVNSGGAYSNWRGHAFEILCQYHAEELKLAINIGDVKTSQYPWTSSRKKGGAQLDLVFERADKLVNICEMKFTDDVFAMDEEYEKKLMNKKKVFKEESGMDWPVKIVLVSARGMKYNQYSDQVSKVITLDDLFDAGMRTGS